MCIKRVFSAKYRVSSNLTSFLLKNAFKRREMLVVALVSLFSLIQCVCTFPSAFIALKPIMCLKRFFSAKYRVSAILTSFKSREMLVVALVSLVVHSSMRLHISQCFQCVKTDNVHKTRFSAFNVVLAEKRVLTQ